MYYITNQTSQVVAIDPELLSSLNVENADTFYKKTAQGEVAVDLVEERVNITVDGKIHSFTATIHPMSGVLGEISLVSLDTISAPQIEEEIHLDLDEASALQYISEDTREEEQTVQSSDEMLSLDEIDLFGTQEEEAEAETEAQEAIPETPEAEPDELFELILPTDAQNAIAEIEEEVAEKSAVPKKSTEEANTPIYIDIENVSKKIGISHDDYTLFLNEYIDTALTFEEALQSNKEKEKEEALNTLSHLSNVLHLPYVGELLAKIQEAEASEQEEAIASFFSALGRLTTSRVEETPPTETAVTEEPVEAEVPVETADETPTETAKPSIDLSGIKPIHFDFQLEAAAKDLSLPVELIEEFVNDFITQAHDETKKMLEAYDKGDLDTIQKIGHLLKGTSSNLRITPLADTLYEIQFNEDIDRVPELVKNYWAHFLSLENQIKLISK
jgi:hypothetical protein